MRFTILITCVGGELVPELIRGLRASRRHEVRVIGVDASVEAHGRHFCDTFEVVPSGDDVGYAEHIAALAERHGVDLVLPTSDEEALALSAERYRFDSGGPTLACASHDVLEIVANKVTAYQRLTALGLHMPRWVEASSVEEIEQAVAQMTDAHGEAVVKPAVERGGRGVCIVSRDHKGVRRFDDRRETHMDIAGFHEQFIAGYADAMPVLVMERLVEPVYDLDLLAWEGEAIRVVPRRRIDSAVPNEGHVIVGDAELLDLGDRIVSGLGLSWLYDCDIMYDRGGRPCVLEINPRQSGSVAVSIAAGIPLIDDVLSLAKGEAVPETVLPVGRRVVPFKSLAIA